MSIITDVSGKLGEYMLKGWILTDHICSRCSKVPLMRSPSSLNLYFCVNCDANPSTATQTSSQLSMPQPSRLSVAGSEHPASVQSSPVHTPSSPHSRLSTPPTEVSSAPSSPTFALPVDTEEILRRRQQSDRASAELGKRMLRGWAMLADECPSSGCYGVPLVRPPKVGSDKDPRKECVICGTVYVYEKDTFGQDHLVPLNSNGDIPDSGGSGVGQRGALSQSSVPPPSAPPGKDKGKAVARNDVPYTLSNDMTTPGTQAVHPETSTTSALDASASSLELTLHALSDRLKSLASMPVVEPSLIAQTADAITKVSQALMQVKQLLWNENQTYGA
ncbi:hypothetical protein B0H21DRAFT_345451 [Amylocystis lapponica]|nr:hypothetical protein B0H21DRAFT_345451 [Amylocystis lapponica]